MELKEQLHASILYSVWYPLERKAASDPEPRSGHSSVEKQIHTSAANQTQVIEPLYSHILIK
jgi:hypothetical protein